MGAAFSHLRHWFFYPDVVRAGLFEISGIYYNGYHIASETVDAYLYCDMSGAWEI